VPPLLWSIWRFTDVCTTKRGVVVEKESIPQVCNFPMISQVAQRILNDTLVHGFELWRERTAKEKQMKAKTLRMVLPLANQVWTHATQRTLVL
jgi:hypothetical protein